MLNYEYYNFSEIENTPTKKTVTTLYTMEMDCDQRSIWLASTRTIGVPESWVYAKIMTIILVGQMVMVAYLQIKPHLWDWFFTVDLLVFFLYFDLQHFVECFILPIWYSLFCFSICVQCWCYNTRPDLPDFTCDPVVGWSDTIHQHQGHQGSKNFGVPNSYWCVLRREF